MLLLLPSVWNFHTAASGFQGDPVWGRGGQAGSQALQKLQGHESEFSSQYWIEDPPWGPQSQARGWMREPVSRPPWMTSCDPDGIEQLHSVSKERRIMCVLCAKNPSSSVRPNAHILLSNARVSKLVQAPWHHNPLSKNWKQLVGFLNFHTEKRIWSQFAAKKSVSFFLSLATESTGAAWLPQIKESRASLKASFMLRNVLPIPTASACLPPAWGLSQAGFWNPTSSEWGGWELAKAAPAPQRNALIMCMKGEKKIIFNGLSQNCFFRTVQSWSID